MQVSAQPITSAPRLPPGPTWSRDEQTLRWSARPTQLLNVCYETFGPIFTLRFRDWGEHVVLGRSDLVRPVLAGDPQTLLAGQGNGPLKPLLGVGSLLCLDGKPHARERSELQPAFRPRAIGVCATAIDAGVHAATMSWRDGDVVPLTAALLEISRRVIVKHVLGSGGEALDPELERVLVSLLESAPAAASLPRDGRALDASGIASRSRIERLRHELQCWLSANRAALSGSDGLIGEWLRAEDETLSIEQLGDRVLTLVLAGHETTAAALSWTLTEVSADPRVAGELRQNLDDDAYVDAVNQESLRLHPPIPVISRRLARDFRLGSWTLPSGVFVTPCIWLVHRDPEVFPEPARFDPHRFLGRTYRPHEYLPFGGGARRCIGSHFALSEMRHVLRSLLRRFDFEPVAREPLTVRRSVTLVPAGGGALQVRRTRQ